jgi:homoserine kinase
MTGFVEGAVRVSVPATSANLGPGFDCLGLALDLRDDLTARITPGGLHIAVEGEGGGTGGVPRDETHLVVRAMRRTFERLGVAPPGLHVSCVNRIPHARGLGSSAAAIVAGILLARGLILEGTQLLGAAEVVALADEIEGHPDNVAACLLGGLTIAWTDLPAAEDLAARPPSAARAVRCELHPSVVPVALVPPVSASTELARGLLPHDVPHVDAVFNAARAALLVAGLTAQPQILPAATADRLHQPYRSAAMPDTAQLVTQLRAAGYAAVVSGAGPTVLVLARGDVEAEEIRALAPEGWRALVLDVDRRGALDRVQID